MLYRIVYNYLITVTNFMILPLSHVMTCYHCHMLLIISSYHCHMLLIISSYHCHMLLYVINVTCYYIISSCYIVYRSLINIGEYYMFHL